MIAMAILRAGTGDVMTNPDADTTVNTDDRLVVVSAPKRAGSLGPLGRGG